MGRKARIRNTSTRISTISTIILIVLLIVFALVTTTSIFNLKEQVELSTEHPFVIIGNVGKINSALGLMKGKMERLQLHSEVVDVKKVEADLDKIYTQINPILIEIHTLYLGSQGDYNRLNNTISELKLRQADMLKYALAHTSAEVEAEQKRVLYPLYEAANQATETILINAQQMQDKVETTSQKTWRNTLILSITIVSLTIVGLVAYQISLDRANQEIYWKTKQFETLSYTIDKTFMIFENDKKSCDFVAGNSETVLGIKPEDLMADRKILYKNVFIGFRDKVEAILGDESQQIAELSVKYKMPTTKQYRWLAMKFYKTNDNKVVKHIMMISDKTDEVTARAALEDALKNANIANNTKRDFMSRMSHEIRTPMNAIIGMTTIAAASIDNKSKVEDCLSKIGFASKHLLMLINDILDMSRIENGKQIISSEPFELYQFVNNFVSMIYLSAQVKGVEFSQQVEGFEDTATYLGDPLRLNQILLNLTSNAIKFTDKGGKVKLEVTKISTRDNIDMVKITVSDTGIGMDAGTVSRIYEPFEQGNMEITRKYGGTGLGMSITKNLVSLMGGYIDVKSKIGEGTIFSVELPMVRSDVVLGKSTIEKISSLRVLVVDNQSDACEHTVLLLDKMNIAADWALSGREAVAKIVEADKCNNCFDVCFIDLDMEGINGIETTKQIRAEVGDETPIIIISANDWTEIEAQARSAGANAFIAKPLFLSSIYNSLVSVTNGTFGRSSTKLTEQECLLNGKKILVVEDNSLNLEIAEELLKMSGAIVSSASNGRQAVEAFTKSKVNEFDVILMDIQMPILNGYEATQEIRKMSRADAQIVPIIAITANAFSEDISAAIASGMNAHISKPIDIKKICEVVNKLVVRK